MTCGKHGQLGHLVPNAHSLNSLMGLAYMIYIIVFASFACIIYVAGFGVILLIFTIQLLVLPGFNCLISSFLYLLDIGMNLL